MAPNHANYVFAPKLEPVQQLGETQYVLSGADDSSPRVLGMRLKYVSLVTLAIQNALLTIIMHHSRISIPPSRAYSAASAVLLNELIKAIISLTVAFLRTDVKASRARGGEHQKALSDDSADGFIAWLPHRVSHKFRILGKEVFNPDCWKLAIPAILYVIQNNLQYVAASNLDAATFQVTYQLKILSTAAFSVLLLRKRLSSSKWIALLLLALGVGIVQIQSSGSMVAKTTTSPGSVDVHEMSPIIGFIAVFAACFTSGFAGVYFEMVLKSKGSQGDNDLWIKNVQLSFFSLLPAVVPVLFSSSSNAECSGWFYCIFKNFGLWAWATVAVQVFGGLVTAIVIKYSDNILKGFATSLSIIISFLASIVLFDFHVTMSFMFGAAIVLLATWLYNQAESNDALSKRHVVPFELPTIMSRRGSVSTHLDSASNSPSVDQAIDTSITLAYSSREDSSDACTGSDRRTDSFADTAPTTRSLPYTRSDSRISLSPRLSPVVLRI